MTSKTFPDTMHFVMVAKPNTQCSKLILKMFSENPVPRFLLYNSTFSKNRTFKQIVFGASFYGTIHIDEGHTA